MGHPDGHELIHPPGMSEGDDERDQPSQTVADEADVVEAECVQQSHDVGGHRLLLVPPGRGVRPPATP